MTQSYDDRLDGHDGFESLMDTAEEITRELAEEHYEACYDEELCGACAEHTPIDGEWGPWMGLKRQFDNLVRATESEVREMGEDIGFVSAELSGTYLDHFTETAADPEDCGVCTHKIVGEDEMCGHERYGEDCPADA